VSLSLHLGAVLLSVLFLAYTSAAAKADHQGHARRAQAGAPASDWVAKQKHLRVANFDNVI
jgi:hypothetical protein